MAKRKDKYGNTVHIDDNASPAEQKRQMADYNRENSPAAIKARKKQWKESGYTSTSPTSNSPPSKSTSKRIPEPVFGDEGPMVSGADGSVRPYRKPTQATQETPKAPVTETESIERNATGGGGGFNWQQAAAGIAQGIGAGMQNLHGFGGATRGFGAAVSGGMSHGSAAVQNQQKLDYYESVLSAQLSHEREAFKDQMDQVREMFAENKRQMATNVQQKPEVVTPKLGNVERATAGIQQGLQGPPEPGTEEFFDFEDEQPQQQFSGRTPLKPTPNRRRGQSVI